MMCSNVTNWESKSQKNGHWEEWVYDPEVEFDKSAIFSAFDQNVAFLWNLPTFNCC